MTKVVRTNRSKGIVAISQKDKYLNKLKILSKYLSTHDPNLLPGLVSDKASIQKLKYRSIALLLNYPKIIHYINKHLNDLYLFNSWKIEDWFFTISEICRMSGINNQNMFRYSKFQIDETSDFFKTIKLYYKELGRFKPSNSEINALYILFKAGIITDDDLNDLKVVIDGKEKKSTAEKKVQQIIQQSFSHTQNDTSTIDLENEERSLDKLPNSIKEFISKVQNYIKNRNACRNCPLYSNGSVILDTNIQQPGPVDLLFIGLNPGKDEIKAGVPFVGKAGNVLKRSLLPLINRNGLTYMITNCILCYTNNEQDIPNPMGVVKNCKDLVNEIIKQFPPKLTVLIGDKSMKSMGVKGGISKQTGTVVDGYFILIHPSSVLYNPKLNLPKFEKSFAALEQIITGNVPGSDATQPIVNIQINQMNIPEDRLITRFTPDLSLFDIQVIDEQIVYIMKDSNGKKRYMMEQIQFPVFIKSGQYKDCKLINSENMEGVAYLSSAERSNLMKKLYHNAKGFTG